MTGAENGTTKRSRPRGLLAAVIVGGAALVALVVVVTLGAVGPARSGGELHGTDMKGHSVTLDEGSGLTPKVVQEMHATADTGSDFEIPSVGLTVPLGSLQMTSNTITPPGFASAYQVRNLGVAPAHAAEGTVFVAMHSCRNGAICPGNYVIDVQNQKAKVGIGATIDVAGVSYTVTGTQAIGKTSISQDSSVWANTPNRLVVITCLQRPQGGPSVDNMVIIANRTPTP